MKLSVAKATYLGKRKFLHFTATNRCAFFLKEFVAIMEKNGGERFEPHF
ncbi:hypothetical protein DB29_01477 [Shouchella clausii]|nr:hypothetical protein DB29_01477 [Shouchella clausii]